MATFDWTKAKAAAVKILGKDADVPDPPGSVQKALDTMGKAYEQFKKSCDALEKDLLNVENGNDEIKNALKQFEATIAKSDLGLNSKSKDDAKKIQQARKILVDRIGEGLKKHDANAKMLDELDKHVIQLDKYKPGEP